MEAEEVGQPQHRVRRRRLEHGDELARAQPLATTRLGGVAGLAAATRIVPARPGVATEVGVAARVALFVRYGVTRSGITIMARLGVTHTDDCARRRVTLEGVTLAVTKPPALRK